MLRLAYGQADALVFRWLDGYVQLDDAQTLRVRAALDAWFAWNRRTQLADYAALLDGIHAAVPADTTAEVVCGWWDDAKKRIDLGLEQAAPALAGLVSTLTAAQIGNVEQRYAKSNREFTEEYLQADPSKRHREAVKRVVGRVETLYGGIDDAQRERIAAWVARSPFDPEVAIEERRRRQHDTLQLLRRLNAVGPAAERTQAEVKDYLLHLNHSPREPYRRYAERLVQHNCRLAADIHNGTTPRQRQVAVQRLKGWATDLRALVADAG